MVAGFRRPTVLRGQTPDHVLSKDNGRPVPTVGGAHARSHVGRLGCCSTSSIAPRWSRSARRSAVRSRRTKPYVEGPKERIGVGSGGDPLVVGAAEVHGQAAGQIHLPVAPDALGRAPTSSCKSWLARPARSSPAGGGGRYHLRALTTGTAQHRSRAPSESTRCCQGASRILQA
jgi:hypothetical protein